MKIRIQNVKDLILNETKKDLVVIKNNKTFIGKLFFKKTVDERLCKIFDEIEIDDENDAIKAMLELLNKHDMMAKDGSTEKVIKHWGWINCLFDEMHYDYI